LSETDDSAASLPIVPVEYDSPTPSRRFYLAGIVGASFGTLATPDAPPALMNQSLMTGGGTIGVAFDRPHGSVRLEFEGLAREQMQINFSNLIGMKASDGWSTMANVWRDYSVNDRLGLYAGGGIGAGGYRFSADATDGVGFTVNGNSSIVSFAWQAGGGVTYALSERVTLDLGYRFFALQQGTTPLTVTGFGPTPLVIPLDTAFSSSELLLSVRIYEPFRNWR